MSAKVKYTQNTVALRYLLQQNTVSLELCSNSSYSGIPIASFPGRLLLHFLDCISDLWTARRSGAVQRSHMMSRKLSRTQPGNEASIPVYLKPWIKALADFLKPIHEHWYQLQDGKEANTNERVTSGMLAFGIPQTLLQWQHASLVINICSLQ